jgi:hypothetical protein
MFFQEPTAIDAEKSKSTQINTLVPNVYIKHIIFLEI